MASQPRPMTVGLYDVGSAAGRAGAPAIRGYPSGTMPVAGSPFSADILIIRAGAAQELSADVRRAAVIARATGVRHIVLAVKAAPQAPESAVPTAFEAMQAAFEALTRRLDFATAITTVDSADASADLGRSPSELGEHLAQLAASEPLARSGAAEPLPPSERFAAHVACISADAQLLPGREYRLRLAGKDLIATVTAIKYRLDIETLQRHPARTLAPGEVGVCTIATETPVSLDRDSGDAGRFEIHSLTTGAPIAAGNVDFALRRGMNVHWQPLSVTKALRASLKEQRPCVVWFTGLSGAGKSTVANLVEGWLAMHGCHTYLLDGDNIRHGLNKDLGFTAVDRVENIRRVGEVARLFVDAGVIVLCSFISPFRAERAAVRGLLDPGEFIEVHVTAPLAVCEQRDPKGLYAKSRAGQLPNFTGIDSPYEAPENPDLILDTTSAPAEELAQRVVSLLATRRLVMPGEAEPLGVAAR